MNLSPKDLLKWLEVLNNRPVNPLDMPHWVEHSIKKLFPFERLFCVHGILSVGEIKPTHWLAFGHDELYVQQISQNIELQCRSSLSWWLTHRPPFLIDPNKPAEHVNQFEIDEINQFNLKNIAAHGVLNLKANAGTYFSFTGVQEPLSDWHLDILSLIIPTLNDAFLAYITQQKTQTTNVEQLTPKQIEIVRLVVQGLDDKTIARKLSISLQTVRNQLSTVYATLDISKRVQLLTLFQ